MTPTHFEGAEWDGPNQDLKSDVDQNDFGVQWSFRHDRYGMVRITGFNSATSVTAEVLRRLPDSLTTVPTYRWAFGAFSTARGWPSIVVHWAGRQVHIKDFDIHASVAGDYGGGEVNFQTLTNSGIVAADLAFRTTLREHFERAELRGELAPNWKPERAAFFFYALISGFLNEWLRGNAGFELAAEVGPAVCTFLACVAQQPAS